MNSRTLTLGLAFAINAAIAVLLGASPWPAALGTAAGWVAQVLLVEFTRGVRATPKRVRRAGLVAACLLIGTAVFPWAVLLICVSTRSSGA